MSVIRYNGKNVKTSLCDCRVFAFSSWELLLIKPAHPPRRRASGDASRAAAAAAGQEEVVRGRCDWPGGGGGGDGGAGDELRRGRRRGGRRGHEGEPGAVVCVRGAARRAAAGGEPCRLLPPGPQRAGSFPPPSRRFLIEAADERNCSLYSFILLLRFFVNFFRLYLYCLGLVFSGEMWVCRLMVGPPPGGNWFNWFLSFAAKCLVSVCLLSIEKKRRFFSFFGGLLCSGGGKKKLGLGSFSPCSHNQDLILRSL